MVRAACVLVIAFALPCCALRAPVAKRTDDTPIAAPGDPLESRIDAVAARLATQGFSVSGWSWTDDIAPLETVSHEMDCGGAARRIVIVALGDGNLSIDLAVKRPDGRVAEDRGPERRAALEFVSVPGEVLTVDVASSSGHGRFLAAAFHAPADAPSADLASLFDADPIGPRRDDDAMDRMRSLGYAPMDEPRTVAVSRGDVATRPVAVEADRCYVLAALGSPGIDSIFLRIREGRDLLGADLSGRAQAWVRFCADREMSLVAEAETRAGSGSVSFLVFGAPRDALGDEAEPPLRLVSRTLDAEAAARVENRRMARRGLVSSETVADVRLSAGETRRAAVVLEAGDCAIFSSAADSRVESFSLAIPAENLSAVCAGCEPPAFPQLGFCSTGRTSVEIEISVLSGSGRVVARRYAVPRLGVPDLGDWAMTLAARGAAAFFGIHGLTFAGRPLPFVSKGDGAVAEIDLDAGRCYGLAAIGASGESRLLAPEGEPVATVAASPDGSAVMSVCPGRGGRFSMRIAAKDGRPVLLVFEPVTAAPTRGRNRP